MKAPTWRDRLRYRFDTIFSRGAAAQIAGLGMISLAVILVAAVILTLARVAPQDGEPLAFEEAAWLSLMRTLDPGTMGGDAGWGFRIVMLGVTFGGIFIISTFIGVVTSGIESRLTDLRKGRSAVVESGHTLILGWSDQLIPIVGELMLANENQSRAAIVILAEQDKVAMEDALLERLRPTGRTRLVCRTGSPIDAADLRMVSVETSKAIIVLSPDTESPDADVIKAILAITNSPERRSEPYHIVAEIRDPANQDAARMVGRGEVEIVLVGELISRMIAQTCRQSGLSVVYNDLLDFAGDEIYFKEEPDLVGRTVGEALHAYHDSLVIGLARSGRPPQLLPDLGQRIEIGDQLIFIAEDDDTIRPSEARAPAIDRAILRQPSAADLGPESTLILGWNWRAALVLAELDPYVAPGSHVTVVARPSHTEAEILRAAPLLVNSAIDVILADPSNRAVLDRLDLSRFDHVIALAADGLGSQRADALTLMTLLHLRDIADQRNLDISIVSEMLDVRNRELADVTRADDFIVSDRVVSLMLAQVSENKALHAVFEDLFNSEGAEIYLKPAEEYVAAETEVDFYTLLTAAADRGEIAIGYRQHACASDARRGYGVVLNPVKSHRFTLAPKDRLIVLAGA